MPVIEEQEVHVMWAYRNKTFYIKSGFKFTKIGDTFSVPLLKLPQNAIQEVLIICDTCKESSYKKYCNVVDKKLTYCTPKCAGIAKRQRVQLECEYCKEPIEKTVFQYNKHEHHFCSNSCSLYFRDYSNRRTKCICEYCKGEYTKINSHYNRDGSRFCSMRCRNMWESEYKIGENHHSFKAEKVPCSYCSKLNFVTQSKIKNQNNHFCNIDCRQKWFSEVWSQREEWVDESRIRAVRILNENKITTKTSCQKIANEMLDKLEIAYINEYPCVYYSIDNYLNEFNLMIEIMGDYWHSNPVTYSNKDILNKIQKKRVSKDKAKNSFVKNNYNINILYLWESDIKKNPELCAELILLYIENEGELKDYNSFNYDLSPNGEVQLKYSIIEPYFLRSKLG